MSLTTLTPDLTAVPVTWCARCGHDHAGSESAPKACLAYSVQPQTRRETAIDAACHLLHELGIPSPDRAITAHADLLDDAVQWLTRYAVRARCRATQQATRC